MIDIYVKEFIGIVKYLEKNDFKPYKGYYVIEKEILKKLLDHNGYETSDNKLKIWKALKWIDADDNRLTKRVAGKAMIKVDIGVYDGLKKVLNW